MHQVVPAGGVSGLFAQHLEGEFTKLAGQRRLVQVLERAGHDVLDEHAGREFDDGRLVAGSGPGEYVHLYSALGE